MSYEINICASVTLREAMTLILYVRSLKAKSNGLLEYHSGLTKNYGRRILVAHYMKLIRYLNFLSYTDVGQVVTNSST